MVAKIPLKWRGRTFALSKWSRGTMCQVQALILAQWQRRMTPPFHENCRRGICGSYLSLVHNPRARSNEELCKTLSVSSGASQLGSLAHGSRPGVHSLVF